MPSFFSSADRKSRMVRPSLPHLSTSECFDSPLRGTRAAGRASFESSRRLFFPLTDERRSIRLASLSRFRFFAFATLLHFDSAAPQLHSRGDRDFLYARVISLASALFAVTH